MSTTTLEPIMSKNNTHSAPIDIKNVTVIGAGTMGNGICHVFANHGYNVSMMDISQEAMNKAMATIAKNMDRQIAKQTMTKLKKKQHLAELPLILKCRKL